MAANEDVPFHLKFMYKYGWKEGKGLGREENGTVDPIKLKQSFDSVKIGNERKDEIGFQWWDHVYNKAASNMDVETSKDGQLKITMKKELKMSVRRPSYKEPKTLYRGFVKGGIVDGHKEIPREDSDEDTEEEVEELDTLKRLSDKELFKLCGGKTAHKAARHGINMSGKLNRIKEQEMLLLQKWADNAKKNTNSIKPKLQNIKPESVPFYKAFSPAYNGDKSPASINDASSESKKEMTPVKNLNDSYCENESITKSKNKKKKKKELNLLNEDDKSNNEEIVNDVSDKVKHKKKKRKRTEPNDNDLHLTEKLSSRLSDNDGLALNIAHINTKGKNSKCHSLENNEIQVDEDDDKLCDEETKNHVSDKVKHKKKKRKEIEPNDDDVQLIEELQNRLSDNGHTLNIAHINTKNKNSKCHTLEDNEIQIIEQTDEINNEEIKNVVSEKVKHKKKKRKTEIKEYNDSQPIEELETRHVDDESRVKFDILDDDEIKIIDEVNMHIKKKKKKKKKNSDEENSITYIPQNESNDLLFTNECLSPTKPKKKKKKCLAEVESYDANEIISHRKEKKKKKH